MEKQELGENLEGSLLFESVAKKIEGIIEKFSPVGTAAEMFSGVFKTAGKAIPFAYKPAKQLQGLLTKDFLEPHGYEYKPEEVIYVAFQILERNGALTKEEAEFIRGNYIAIKRLILERSSQQQGQAQPKESERITAGYEAVKALVRATLGRKETKKKQKKEKPPMTPDAMSEFDLLDLDVFNLAELMSTDPVKFNEILSGASRGYRTPGAKAEHYRRLFGIDGDVPDEAIEETFKETQAKFLERMNGLLEQILRMFHKKEENIEKGKFKGKVGDVKSIFELYDIISKVEYGAILGEGALEEIDQARVKLALYLRAAKIRLSPQYRLRSSIKAYMDEYLGKNIFRLKRKVEVPVPISSPIDATKMRSAKVKVWEAELIDRDGEDPVPVYLYIGGDSEHPEKEKSGVVNLKSMAKAVLKSFATRKEPDDLFRMTVMPVLERPEDLQRVGDILAQTILHPQSLDISSAVEDKNSASAYGKRNVRSVVTTIVPSVVQDGKLLRGFIRDVKNSGEPTRLSSFKMEVRIGPTREVVSEHHPFDDSNHGVYRIIRMLPAFNKLRNPERYLENWVGRAVQMFDSMQGKLEQTSADTLPLWVREKFMRTYLSVLEHGGREASKLSLL